MRFLENEHRFASEKEFTGYALLTARDGTHFPFEFRNSLVIENGVAVAVRGIARNISGQREVEKTRRDHDRSFQRLVS